MGLDFWAVKIKKGVTKKYFEFSNPWHLIENEEIYDLIDNEISEFKLNQNDKTLYQFCIDTVGFFVGGDPIYEKSREDINLLANKLNIFIKENPDYEYILTYSNKDVRKFIKYINLVKENGFVLWCSW